MTYKELDNLCSRIHKSNRRWGAYICSEGLFWNDYDCPRDCGEIRVRLGMSSRGVVGRIVVSQPELAAHTEESLELLIDEIGISALLSQGVDT